MTRACHAKKSVMNFKYRPSERGFHPKGKGTILILFLLTKKKGVVKKSIKECFRLRSTSLIIRFRLNCDNVRKIVSKKL